MSTRFTQPVDVSGWQARLAVGSYSTYREAEAAVDYLSDNGFPVERATIAGRGLQLVELVTGRMGYAESALRGALAGGVVGVLIGWLFGVFNWFDPVVASSWLALDGLWFGVAVGALIGLAQHALTRGRRDFASVGGLAADRYEVLVDQEAADEARRLLSLIGDSSVTPQPEAREPEGASR
jgi:hypothetical protein